MHRPGGATALCALIVGGGLAFAPMHAPAASGVRGPGTPVPGTACSVFPANNIWNTDISTMPVNTHSAAWLTSTGAGSGRLLHPDFGGPPYGIPFNVVDNTHATTTFTFQYPLESDGGPYPYGSDLQIEQGSDAHLLSINQNTCKLYETWATNYAGPSTAGSGAIFDLGSNQLRTDGFTSADAAGLPIFPGLVRLDEVAAGFIGHAIRFTVQQSDASHLWPARHDAGTPNPNLPPMGARFRLKSTYNISGFSAATQVVLTAMQHYGLIVADNGSNWFFQGTEDAGWGSGPYPTMISELKTIPAAQYEAIDESSLMVDPNSGLAGLRAPTNVSGTPADQSVSLTWTQPASDGGSPITSYIVTASDGCTIQGSVTVTGSPPATSVVFQGLTNGTAYTFTVAAVNANGTGPPSAPSPAVTPAGATFPVWVTACSTKQYSLAGSDGATWRDIDPSTLRVSLTPFVDSVAVLSANVDLWTAASGYNQDIGIAVAGGTGFPTYPAVPGQPEVWKESGGSAGTFSPNAASVQTVVRMNAGHSYAARLVWKTNRPDPGAIFAGAGPLSAAFSPTRLTVHLIPISSNALSGGAAITQLSLKGSDGHTWTNMSGPGVGSISAGFAVPSSGLWMAILSGNADLWTSSSGYNQDIGITLSGPGYPGTGQPDVWKESGGSAGTFSPNAAFIQAALPVAAGGGYTATLQWKANRADPGTIWAGAGPVSGRISQTTVLVILVRVGPFVAGASSTGQYAQANSDGSTWKPLDRPTLQLVISPTTPTSYALTANADLWTSVAGYNQDLGIMVSGGAYGTGTLVAWKESGGLAGTYSPNAAVVTTDLHLVNGMTYTIWIVWKANRQATGPNSIFVGAGPINGHYSPTWLTAEGLSQP